MLGSRARAYESACIRIVGKDCDIAVSAGMPAQNIEWKIVGVARMMSPIDDRRSLTERGRIMLFIIAEMPKSLGSMVFTDG
jgi:hypothetical protein